MNSASKHHSLSKALDLFLCSHTASATLFFLSVLQHEYSAQAAALSIHSLVVATLSSLSSYSQQGNLSVAATNEFGSRRYLSTYVLIDDAICHEVEEASKREDGTSQSGIQIFS
jgi:hypothetical protein